MRIHPLTSHAREDLSALYREFNTKYFGGELPEVPAVWGHRKGNLGTTLHVGMRPTKIEISTVYALTPEQTKSVLLHEMIHVWQASQPNYGDDLNRRTAWERAHGKSFQTMKQKIEGLAGVKINDRDDAQEFQIADDVKAKEYDVVFLLNPDGGVDMSPLVKGTLDRSEVLDNLARMLWPKGTTVVGARGPSTKLADFRLSRGGGSLKAYAGEDIMPEFMATGKELWRYTAEELRDKNHPWRTGLAGSKPMIGSQYLSAGSLRESLLALRPAMAKAAQEVYDAWDQNEEGIDEMLGGGGICDEVSQAIGGLIPVDVMDGGQDGDDHAYVIAYDSTTREAYGVDIHPTVYETGAGYSWKKRPGVTIRPQDVEVFPLDYDDLGIEEELESGVEMLTSGAEAFMSAVQVHTELIKAMVNLNPVKITYRDRNGRMTRRVEEPYKLCTKFGKNWIYTYSRLRDDHHVRMFRLDRIKRIDNLIEQSYQPRWDVEAVDGYEAQAKRMAEEMGFFEKKPKAKKK